VEVKESSNELVVTFNEKGFNVNIVTFEGQLRDDSVFVAHEDTARQLFPEKRELTMLETAFVITAVAEYSKTGLPKVEFAWKNNREYGRMDVKASSSDLTIAFNDNESNICVIMFGGERYVGNVFGAYGETGELVTPEKRKLTKSETVYVIDAVVEYCKTGIPKVEFVWLHHGI